MMIDLDAVIADLQRQLDDLTRAVATQQVTIDELTATVTKLTADARRH